MDNTADRHYALTRLVSPVNCSTKEPHQKTIMTRPAVKKIQEVITAVKYGMSIADANIRLIRGRADLRAAYHSVGFKLRTVRT